MHLPGFKRVREYLTKRRHKRFLWLFDFPENGLVLDISCGDGDFLSSIQSYFPQLELHGIDIGKDCIEKAKSKHSSMVFEIANAESIPYPEEKFNVVLSCMSLHHYENPNRVFFEVARVLTPNGKFYLIDLIPSHRILQMLHNSDGCPEPYHFEKYYLQSETESIAKTAGLKICGNKRIERFASRRLLTFEKQV